MLILARLENERIIIGEGDNQVIVTVVSARGNVKLGIDAPRGVSIDREEVWLKKQQGKGNENGKKDT